MRITPGSPRWRARYLQRFVPYTRLVRSPRWLVSLLAGLVVSLTALAGCSDEATLLIDVRTDLRPGEEFHRVAVEIAGEVDGIAVSGGEPFLEGVRVLERPGLEPGPLAFVVRLGSGDSSVMERSVRIDDLSGTVGVTVAFTRDCRGVVCDDDAAPACLNGACVAEYCTAENLTACGPAQCASDGDCTSGSECGVARCTEGACLYETRIEMCVADERCDPLIGCAARSQGVLPTLEWARRVGGTRDGEVEDLAVDGAGNIYLVGRVGEGADFGGGPLPGGTRDPFAASLDADAMHRWSRTFEVEDVDGSPAGTQRTTAWSIAVADDGSSYVVGGVDGLADFGDGTPLPRLGPETDAFVVGLDPTGATSWAHRFGGASDNVLYAAMYDGTGLIAGGYHEQATDVGGVLLPGDSVDDDVGYLVRIDATGTIVWARDYGDGLDDRFGGLVLDQSGTTFVAAAKWDGEDDLGAVMLRSDPGGEDATALRFDLDGEPLAGWNTGVDPNDGSQGTAIARDAAGNYYIAAEFHGEQTLGGETFVSRGSEDALIVSLTPDLSYRWHHHWGQPSSDAATDVAVDTAGNVWVTGEYEAITEFPGGPLWADEDCDLYVISFTSDGTHRFSWGFGGRGDDEGFAIAAAPDGSVYVGGQFGSDVTVEGTDVEPGPLLMRFR